MESIIRIANVVIAARQFNPTIFDPIWLLDNGLATREELQAGNAFTLTPPFVQFCAPAYILVVLPDQLQFTPQPLDDNSGRLIVEKVGRIVQLLPQTPYAAAGLNFVWHLIPEQAQFAEFSRAVFFQDNPLFAAFQQDDARFGGYLSRNTLGARLRLDVRPVRTTPIPEGPEALQFGFNYNVDIPRSPAAVEQVLRFLERRDEAKQQAEHLVQAIQNWR